MDKQLHRDSPGPPASGSPVAGPYLQTVMGCALAAALLLPLHSLLNLVNVAMLLLLVVALVAFRFGRGPAIVASVLNVAIFDIGFVAPRGSFSVQDAEYIVVFAVMLAVAVIISHISGDLRDRRQAALTSSQRQRALYELAAALNATIRQDQVLAVVGDFLQRSFDASVTFHPPADLDDMVEATPRDLADVPLRSVLSTGQSAQFSDGAPVRPVRNLQALKGSTRVRGVLDTRLPALAPSRSAERIDTLSTVAELTTAALERLHYLDVAGRAQAEAEAERLRNSLLATLSHDLRTPLTVLYGHAEALRDATVDVPALQEAASAVCEEALRTNRLCASLLDLAQVLGPKALLRPEWVTLEEIVGTALASLAGTSAAKVRTDLPQDLPWLQLDVVMFERVIANLIDNALKQGGDAQHVGVTAHCGGALTHLFVRNTGSRFPVDADRLLLAFARGDRTDRSAGFGIGLATCHAVVRAHGGTLALRNGSDFAEVEIQLPTPEQSMPVLPAQSAREASAHD